jgi:glycosyltransferase involved in cell wall biosynthesis
MRATPDAILPANAARSPAGHGVDVADITFVVLTRNEAQNIADCLGLVPLRARVLVFDACSTDDTARIARSLGVEVVQEPWQGFVRAREAATKLVRTPWTFMLDADERLTPELVNELEVTPLPSEVAACSVPRRNYFCGIWIRSGGWWPDRLVRLFRTGSAHLQARGKGSGVHETWQVDGACMELHSPIDHYSYASVADYRRKFALYTDLEAAGGQASTFEVLGAWLLVPLRFLWFFLRRGGILEGWRGAYVCAGNAVYPAVVANKRRSASLPQREKAPS